MDETLAFKRVDAANVPAFFFPKNIVWHTMSEHIAPNAEGKDRHYLAEVQIIHEDSEGNLAVLAVFFDVDRSNQDNSAGESAFVKSFLDGFDDRQKSEEDADKKKIDMALLIKELKPEQGFWMYDGSLTTPPCTEGVKWTVMRGALSFSGQQWNQITDFTNGFYPSYYQNPGADNPYIEQKYLD